MQKRNKLAGGLLALAMGIAAGYEGCRTLAYPDVGNVWTICYGETAGVKRGDTATKQQCDSMLVRSLLKHNDPLTALPQMPPNVHLAVLDWTYNVGTGNARGSTLWKYLQQGEWDEACGQFTRWRFAAGKDCAKDKSCRGVYLRRVDESALCRGEITPEQLITKLGSTLGDPDGATAQ